MCVCVGEDLDHLPSKALTQLKIDHQKLKGWLCFLIRFYFVDLVYPIYTNPIMSLRSIIALETLDVSRITQYRLQGPKAIILYFLKTFSNLVVAIDNDPFFKVCVYFDFKTFCDCHII